VTIAVCDTHGILHDLEVVVDTGFNGYLTLSAAQIATFGLLWIDRRDAVTADGRQTKFDIYSATVMWDGHLRNVEVEAVDAKLLIGMGLLLGWDLFVDGRIGGTVRIEAQPGLSVLP